VSGDRYCKCPWSCWGQSITVGRYALLLPPCLLPGSLSAEHPPAGAGRRRVATACPWAAGERSPWHPPAHPQLPPTPGHPHHAGCFLHRESVEGSGRTGSSPFLPFSWFTDSGKGSASSGSTTSPTCSPKHEGFSPKKSASQVSPGLHSFFFSFLLLIYPSLPSFFFPAEAVLLCSPGWPGTTQPLALAFCVLGLEECAILPSVTPGRSCPTLASRLRTRTYFIVAWTGTQVFLGPIVSLYRAAW
jgi:hypothetical protein